MKAHVERLPTPILIRNTQQSFHRRCYADIGLVSAISLRSPLPLLPLSLPSEFSSEPLNLLPETVNPKFALFINCSFHYGNYQLNKDGMEEYTIIIHLWRREFLF